MTNELDNILSDDATMTIYTALLDALALNLDDATITAITTDAPRARDFIASLAHDPDAATDTPADAFIAAYQLIINDFFALDDYDLFADLIDRLRINDRLPADTDAHDLAYAMICI